MILPRLDDEALRRLGIAPDRPVASQIGYVVDDIETACRTFGSRFGVDTWYRPHILKQKLFYLDTPIQRKIDVVVGYAGSTQVELVQRDAERHSLYELVSVDPNVGPHHFGLFVRSLDAVCLRLAAQGMQPRQHGSLWFGKGQKSRVAYYDNRNSFGHIVEIIEHRVQGFYIGMPRWYVALGAITGHVARVRL